MNNVTSAFIATAFSTLFVGITVASVNAHQMTEDVSSVSAGLARNGSEPTFGFRVVEGGAERTPGFWTAEGGAERTPGFRTAEGGAERTPGFRTAEGGSERTPGFRIA